MKSNLLVFLLALFFVVCPDECFASLITNKYQGIIYYVYELDGWSNEFGVNEGDPIYVTVKYDDSMVSPIGNSTVSFSWDDGQELLIEIGSQSLDESGDVAYGSGYPQSSFLNGSLIGINYAHPYWDLGSGRGVFLNNAELIARNGLWDDEAWDLVKYWEVKGTFDFSHPIPIPSPIWMCASGFIALVFFRRDERKGRGSP